MSHPNRPPNPAPTYREMDYLLAAANGLSQAEMAERMGVSVHTIKDRAASVVARLGARTATHAVAIALVKGYIKPSDVEAA